MAGTGIGDRAGEISHFPGPKKIALAKRITPTEALRHEGKLNILYNGSFIQVEGKSCRKHTQILMIFSFGEELAMFVCHLCLIECSKFSTIKKHKLINGVGWGGGRWWGVSLKKWEIAD